VGLLRQGVDADRGEAADQYHGDDDDRGDLPAAALLRRRGAVGARCAVGVVRLLRAVPAAVGLVLVAAVLIRRAAVGVRLAVLVPAVLLAAAVLLAGRAAVRIGLSVRVGLSVRSGLAVRVGLTVRIAAVWGLITVGLAGPGVPGIRHRVGS